MGAGELEKEQDKERGRGWRVEGCGVDGRQGWSHSGMDGMWEAG